jgi:serine/threonine-protein kinase RsbW
VIQVRLYVGEAVLLAEVWDEADGVPARKSVGDNDESGRGLDLVHELTNARWGWYHAPSGSGKCVWAEFPISSGPGRRRTAAGQIPPVNGMPNGAESGRIRPGSGHERPDLNSIRR